MKTCRALFVALAFLLSLVGIADASLAATCAPTGAATFAHWNPAKARDGITLTGDYVASAPGEAAYTVLADMAKSASKFYFEVTETSGGVFPFIGIASPDYPVTSYLGEAVGSYAYENFGSGNSARLMGQTVWSDPVFYPSIVAGGVVGVAVDLSAHKIWWRVNGTWLSGDPANGTGASFSNVLGPMVPALTLYGAMTLSANFGQSAFAHPAPSGFTGWGNYSVVCHGKFVCSSATSVACASWAEVRREDFATFDELGLTGEAVGLAFAFGLGLVLVMWGLSLSFGSVTRMIRAMLSGG